MNYDCILFDLDGTLLPADQDKFTSAYFEALAAKFAPLGYEREALVKGIWAGTREMVKNDGGASNYEVFWKKFASLFGEQVYSQIEMFEEFYRTDFEKARRVCGFEPRAGELVKALKERGERLILASNPVFPLTAQKSRLRWAGVDEALFDDMTSYENSSYCKPNPKYYLEIAQRNHFNPERALMIGNDATEDLAAGKVGMEVFLLTGCLINRENIDISALPHGGYAELKEFLKL